MRRFGPLLLLAALWVAPFGALAQGPTLSLEDQVDGENLAVYALEYARSRGVSSRRLVRGAERGERVDMSWYFFVVVGHGRVILVDCGTDALSRPGRAALRARWSIERATSVIDALSAVELAATDVTDIVLTHHHWDHVGGLSRFPRATVHAHPEEWRRVPRRLRQPVERDGRFSPVTGARTELISGLAVFEAGKHTEHQLMVEVGCAGRRVVLASDAAYLYRNVAEGRPAAVTTDRATNVGDLATAAERVGIDNVIPGHDPEVFARHPSGVPGVAAVCR